MKIVIPGGSGHLGGILQRAFTAAGHEVVVLSRRGGNGRVQWDGCNAGPWTAVIDGADAVINLAGRSVDCRYTDANLREMMDSRVNSTRAIGLAIARAQRPPRVWLQMSTATIYAHRYDAANDERSGIIGGWEPGVPTYWRYSIDIATAWECALEQAQTPHTRKVALRTAMVMSADPLTAGYSEHWVFSVLMALTRFGLGGPIAGGRQFVSWIHERDFVRAVEFLVAREDIEGPVNLAAPNPLPQREFMAALRVAWGTRIGLPATRRMAEIGAIFMRTDAELILKSRRVVPGRLLDAGFSFDFPEWPEAARELVGRWKAYVRAA